MHKHAAQSTSINTRTQLASFKSVNQYFTDLQTNHARVSNWKSSEHSQTGFLQPTENPSASSTRET